MNSQPNSGPLGAKELVDKYFIENRTRLLEIAAFLDRIDRVRSPQSRPDFRMKAFSAALEILGGDSKTRVTEIQMLLSDPITKPLEQLDRKSAMGAYDRWNGEAHS
jgi:hypothetical protein